MPIVEISQQEADRLEEVAPAYLKDDKRATTKRVRWALSEFFKTIDATEAHAEPAERSAR